MKTRYGLIVACCIVCAVLADSTTITGTIIARSDSAATNGIANVTVELVNSNGTVVATAQTDPQGQFVFSNVVNTADVRLKVASAGYVLQMNSGL